MRHTPRISCMIINSRGEHICEGVHVQNVSRDTTASRAGCARSIEWLKCRGASSLRTRHRARRRTLMPDRHHYSAFGGGRTEPSFLPDLLHLETALARPRPMRLNFAETDALNVGALRALVLVPLLQLVPAPAGALGAGRKPAAQIPKRPRGPIIRPGFAPGGGSPRRAVGTGN